MTRAMRIVVAATALAVVLPVGGSATGACAAPAAAQTTNRAGLVVTFPDGDVREYCVAFAEESITGFELLRRSGLELAYKEWGGDQITVCRIEGEGCPSESCFCRCRTTGPRCEMWGYYRLGAGGWRFSEQGASTTVVRDGDVEGWRWGRHGAAGGGAPPDRTDLDGICARGEQIAASSTSARRARSPWPFFAGIAISVGAIAALAWLGVVVRRRQGDMPFEEDEQ